MTTKITPHDLGFGLPGGFALKYDDGLATTPDEVLAGCFGFDVAGTGADIYGSATTFQFSLVDARGANIEPLLDFILSSEFIVQLRRVGDVADETIFTFDSGATWTFGSTTVEATAISWGTIIGPDPVAGEEYVLTLTAVGGGGPAGPTFHGEAWSYLSSYIPGDTVTYLDELWLCNASGVTADPPDVDTGHWQIAGFRAITEHGTWDNATRYYLGSVVTDTDEIRYLCILDDSDNTAYEPSSSPSIWLPLSTGGGAGPAGPSLSFHSLFNKDDTASANPGSHHFCVNSPSDLTSVSIIDIAYDSASAAFMQTTFTPGTLLRFANLTIDPTGAVETVYQVNAFQDLSTYCELLVTELMGSGGDYSSTGDDFIITVGPGGAVGATGPQGGSSSVFQFLAETGATTGDPASYHILWDQATQVDSTSINVSVLDADFLDVTIGLRSLKATDIIYLQAESVSADFQKWEVTGPAVDHTTYFTVPISLLDSGGVGTTGFADEDFIALQVVRIGTPGTTGATGPTGPTGQHGAGWSIDYVWDDTYTDADPGNGVATSDNSDLSSVTQFYVDWQDRFANTVTGLLSRMSDSTSSPKGYLRVYKLSDPTNVWAFYKFDDQGTPSGYRQLYVEWVASNGMFLADDNVVFEFTPSGYAGATGPTGAAGATGADGGGGGLIVATSALMDESVPNDGTVVDLFRGTFAGNSLINGSSQGAIDIYIQSTSYSSVGSVAKIIFEVQIGAETYSVIGDGFPVGFVPNEAGSELAWRLTLLIGSSNASLFGDCFPHPGREQSPLPAVFLYRGWSQDFTTSLEVAMTMRWMTDAEAGGDATPVSGDYLRVNCVTANIIK